MVDFLDIGLFIAAGVLFYAVTLTMSKLVAPRSEGEPSSYECGVQPVGEAQVPFHPNYYLYALIFGIFDVEAVFLFPWAVAARELGKEAFAAMLSFMAVLVVGLAYAWRKKAFRWV
ncbi:MAG TPA: NADH-quinone oxidoreductase subunit A [Firmicutes bacterium]|nr:NADH-quinone oxidoreductase subunit A [Bacillota bacterium]